MSTPNPNSNNPHNNNHPVYEEIEKAFKSRIMILDGAMGN
jgi:hypothetical protein